ncbi:hypothetical protein P170DRAFT_15901 [Aspergillus steynii IBT 23096]|uniref:Uncharacterized protein n=1 Tax=Aspergillus steynii IBT 23096 TaxID=1392250 RepID=A0A2I2GNE8_9EURO|nr:uncharacterized protein P170DRAFT_15901 [Aspergillus steynii IBT 23096]PLB54379.1 hypothetical protein P170DRAFT_15901 [Aspergillus steynii IBT 23096]
MRLPVTLPVCGLPAIGHTQSAPMSMLYYTVYTILTAWSPPLDPGNRISSPRLKLTFWAQPKAFSLSVPSPLRTEGTNPLSGQIVPPSARDLSLLLPRSSRVYYGVLRALSLSFGARPKVGRRLHPPVAGSAAKHPTNASYFGSWVRLSPSPCARPVLSSHPCVGRPALMPFRFVSLLLNPLSSLSSALIPVARSLAQQMPSPHR